MFEQDIPLDLAVAAHTGTSFSPEKRGAAHVAEYAATMTADYEHFRSQAEKGGTLAMLDEQFATYRAGYASRYRAYLSSSARCVSTMIAGPSNFPARRMNKRADVTHKRLNEMLEFRDRARRAVVRNLRPDLAPIRSSDTNAVERLEAEIAQAERVQQRMKDCNAAIRANRKLGQAAQIAALIVLGLSERQAVKLLQPDFAGRIGFASFELTNNGANIRRMRERIENIQRMQSTPDTTEEGPHATVEICPSDNRVRVTFPGKPEESVRDQLKRAAFHWTPSLGVWQAYPTTSAVATARKLAGLT